MDWPGRRSRHVQLPDLPHIVGFSAALGRIGHAGSPVDVAPHLDIGWMDRSGNGFARLRRAIGCGYKCRDRRGLRAAPTAEPNLRCAVQRQHRRDRAASRKGSLPLLPLLLAARCGSAAPPPPRTPRCTGRAVECRKFIPPASWYAGSPATSISSSAGLRPSSSRRSVRHEHGHDRTDGSLCRAHLQRGEPAVALGGGRAGGGLKIRNLLGLA